MDLHKVSQTSTLITLSWTPVANARGYIYYRDGVRISHTLDGTRSTANFGIPDAKPHTYKVEAIMAGDSGTYTVNAPAPAPSGGWGILALGDTLSNVSAAHQQAAKAVIVSLDDGPAAAKLPGRSLVYMNSLKILPSGGSGIPWQATKDLGFLTSTLDPDYNANFSRIDLPAYQQWFAQQAVNLAKAQGVDGIYLDDITGYAKYSPFSLSDQFNWLLETTHAVGAALAATGLYLLVNANGYQPGVSPGSDDGSLDFAWWKQVASYVNGVMTENWSQARDGSNVLRLRGTDDFHKFWDQWQAAASLFHTSFPAVDFFGLSYGDDEALTYCRASLLLANPAGIFLGHRVGDADPSGSWVSGSTPHVDPVAGTATIT